MDLNTRIVTFLHESLSFSERFDPEHLYVTLTFAQSVDARIAGRNKKQLILSGKESLLMTHRMRSMHDAILVGIGTALNDDPQLNCRLLPPEEGQNKNPLPVILDSNLRFSPEAKLLKNFRAGTGRQPLIVAKVCSDSDLEFAARKQQLIACGANVVCITQSGGKLCIPSLVEALHLRGVRSLMVEGGAEVISSFMNSGLVDHLIITVAPTLVGHDGVGYAVGQDGRIPQAEFLRSFALGRDTVTAWKIRRPSSS